MDCGLTATDIHSGGGTLSFRVAGWPFHVPVWGRHHLTAALAARDEGAAAEGLLDRLAADERIPLDRADLDALTGDPLAFVGDAHRQVAAFAATVGALVAEHPEVASYQPDRLL